MLKNVVIFVDGACRGNPGPGGFGALLRFGDQEKKISGAEPYTTNNRMELMAAIAAFQQLKCPCKVDITTDSQYVRKGITEWLPRWQKNNWQTADKKPVKNVDLWQMLVNLTRDHQVQWHWVKGHSGHPENTLVDLLANQAIDEAKAKN